LIARATGSGERISTYDVADTEMAAGSTLGAARGAIVLKATGAIEKFFSSDAGRTLVKDVQIGFWDEQDGVALANLPGTFHIHPDAQEHVYRLANGARVTETNFMLNASGKREAPDPAIAYFGVEIFNDTAEPLSMSSLCAANMRGDGGDDLACTYDDRLHAFVAWNRSDPEHARAFGSMRKPLGYELTNDHGKFARTIFGRKLSGTISADGIDAIALFHHRHHLVPNSAVRLNFALAHSDAGARGVRRVYAGAPSLDAARRATRAYYDEMLGRAVVMTPDADVNRGVLWAKANMLRTQTCSPTGWCFTNDPTRSSNCVARDTAWYAFGADYVTPEFSRESLLAFVERVRKNGKFVEFYDMRTGHTQDYGLNVNDDTPLMIVALWHHYRATGDEEFLKAVYPAARKAARFILSQRDERGLVWCTAKGQADWGIPGWRNVIKGYRISGATTELNSDCYAALAQAGQMARELGRRREAEEFAREAQALREAINRHLIDPDTGLYYLNIGVDGVPRTDVTCDLVFPVMFGVADHETACAIIARLSAPEFWTQAGIRTVPRNDVGYSPTAGYGLLGGVWTGVTFWYAFAAARFNPDFMASALRDSFAHAARDPGRNNTVPGQFCEWLHGETLTNEGMMLSPWFPPRYLWAAIEGAAGLDLSSGEPSCNPRLAPEWRWLGVRNLQLGGGSESWFVVRAQETLMYATFRLASSNEYQRYDDDVTDELLGDVGDNVSAIAMRRGDRLVVFFGNTAARTVWAKLQLRKRTCAAYSAHVYNTIRGEWYDVERLTAAQLHRGIGFEIDRHGFAVAELTPLRGEPTRSRRPT
jgi:hypothetical protein